MIARKTRSKPHTSIVYVLEVFKILALLCAVCDLLLGTLSGYTSEFLRLAIAGFRERLHVRDVHVQGVIVSFFCY